MTSPSATPLAALAQQRVLITGASGFLGTHLCRRLNLAGAEVHAVSRAHRAPGNYGVRWWQVSMEDIAAVEAVLAGVKPDVLFHLGGLVNGAPDLALVLPTLHSLLTSTVNLLAAATRIGCGRLVLVGSLEEPRTGTAEVAPSSPYGAAKWAASAYGRMFHRLYQSPVVILQTFMTYGPAQSDWKIIPYTIQSLLDGHVPKLSSGRRRLDWIYVDDVVEGFLRAALVPGIEGMTIDLGSGTAVPIRTIVARLVTLVDPSIQPVFGALPDRSSEEVRVADVAAARATLGWQPTMPLDEGLARTVDWYRQQRTAPPTRSGSATDAPTQSVPWPTDRDEQGDRA